MNNSNVPHIDDCEHTSARNARVGLALFVVYLVLYGGFMGLATFAYRTMEMPVLGGVNLAIVYGFGLIVGALVLSLIYMVLCRAPARESDLSESGVAGKSREEGRR